MLIHDPDILALAREVYRAVPEVPLQGCDILREAATGKLFAIEINPGGNTWHFSSDFAKPMIEESLGTTEPLIDQFGVFEVAARVLIEKTRAEAE
jgi:hypothetical protein